MASFSQSENDEISSSIGQMVKEGILQVYRDVAETNI